jgi:hypothetical protein
LSQTRWTKWRSLFLQAALVQEAHACAARLESEKP